jgi:aryl-alcohol dehydrogenase-like predicted oxidoreductase
MEWRDLGSSELRLPVIGMGTWRTFDVHGKEANAARARLVRRALDLSVSFFDTSPMYGEAERVLAASLAGRRDAALVATKVWSEEPREGFRQIDRALSYFDNRVDLYQVHNLVNWQTYLPGLLRMKQRGEIGAVGITHYSKWRLRSISELMRAGQIDAIQVPYNPLRREVEEEILPLAGDLGIGVVVMQPFDEGRLMRMTPPPEWLAGFAPFGVQTWPQVLLKWILSRPEITSVIPATRREAHLEENAVAGEGPWFGPDEREEIARFVVAQQG